MSEQIPRYGVVGFSCGMKAQHEGAYVTFADHSARVADLEHRLANCDADLFKMQQELAEEKLRSQALRAHADELAENLNDAERRLGEVEAMLRECFAVRFQWPHSAETDAIWIRVAELVKEQPA